MNFYRNFGIFLLFIAFPAMAALSPDWTHFNEFKAAFKGFPLEKKVDSLNLKGVDKSSSKAWRDLLALKYKYLEIIIRDPQNRILYPTEKEGSKTEDFSELKTKLTQTFGRLPVVLKVDSLSQGRYKVWLKKSEEKYFADNYGQNPYNTLYLPSFFSAILNEDLKARVEFAVVQNRDGDAVFDEDDACPERFGSEQTKGCVDSLILRPQLKVNGNCDWQKPTPGCQTDILLDASFVSQDDFKKVMGYGLEQKIEHLVFPEALVLMNQLNGAAPMIHLTPLEAQHYCEAIGRRLPTNREWDWALGMCDSALSLNRCSLLKDSLPVFVTMEGAQESSLQYNLKGLMNPQNKQYFSQLKGFGNIALNRVGVICAATWFGQPGMGIQFQTEQKVKDYLDSGVLQRVAPVDSQILSK